jgi:hypothetical protein
MTTATAAYVAWTFALPATPACLLKPLIVPLIVPAPVDCARQLRRQIRIQDV